MLVCRNNGAINTPLRQERQKSLKHAITDHLAFKLTQSLLY